MKKLDSQAGFTLLESLIYVGILSILLLATVGFMGLVLDSRVKNQSISEVEQQGTFAMESMTRTLRGALTITTPAAAASGTSLTVTVPTSSLSPTVFSLNGTTLQIKEGTAAAVSLTDGKVAVSNLTFKNLTRNNTPGIVQVSFTVTRVNSGGRGEYSYSATFTDSIALRWPI